MNIHEYQAKGLLKEFGVPVPQGGLAVTPRAAAGITDVHGTGGVGRYKLHHYLFALAILTASILCSLGQNVPKYIALKTGTKKEI